MQKRRDLRCYGRDMSRFPLPSNVLNPKQKIKVMERVRKHDTDTGSADVQIAILSEEIKRLASHLKKHPKDNHSRRGLLTMVSKRKRFLEYLQKTNKTSYEKLIKKLGLRK